jgi:site-specific DNA-methyltransferase (adenine-specific)
MGKERQEREVYMIPPEVEKYIYYQEKDIVLLHGDCLEILPLFPENSIDLVLTDPPYGTTSCAWDSIIPLDIMWNYLNALIKIDNPIILTASQPFTTILISSNLDSFKYCWVWDKKLAGNGMLAKKQPLKVHEDVVVFNSKIYNPQMSKGIKRLKGGIKDKHGTFGGAESELVKNDDYYPTSIIEFSGASMRNDREHPTQKPIELMKYLIKTYSSEGNIVLDFTLGSGTTAVAAKQLGRKCIGIEIEQKYLDIAIERLRQEVLF